MNQATPIILRGASNVRAWPSSGSGFPKRLLSLAGTNGELAAALPDSTNRNVAHALTLATLETVTSGDAPVPFVAPTRWIASHESGYADAMQRESRSVFPVREAKRAVLDCASPRGIIDAQSGGHLDEDDILHFEDTYSQR